VRLTFGHRRHDQARRDPIHGMPRPAISAAIDFDMRIIRPARIVGLPGIAADPDHELIPITRPCGDEPCRVAARG